MVKDIVCGMGVEEDDPETFSKTHKGTVYYFCSPECMLMFAEDPDDYLNPKRKKTAMAKDPICGMDVDKINPPFTSIFKGVTYYFCSNPCKREFDREPEKFLRKKKDPE